MDVDVAVVGSCIIDLICYASHLPKEGETIFGSKFAIGFGGKGANQCVTAGKLGAKVAMVSKVGNDSYGKDYLKNLEDCNVNCEKVQTIQGVSTGVAVISVADNGSNSIIIVPGANNCLSEADVEAAQSLITRARVLVCQNEVPQHVSLAAIKIAKQHNVKVIYNPAPADKNLNAELYQLADYFCPNETEAELLTGQTINDVESAMQACMTLTESHGCQNVVMTLGECGVVYQGGKGEEPIHIPTQQVKAVDTTGAGDSFIGSFAYFLSTKDLPITEVIKRSNVIASVSVTKPGTQTSYPTADQLPKHIFD